MEKSRTDENLLNLASKNGSGETPLVPLPGECAQHDDRHRSRGIVLGLLAAVLFGLSAPLAKLVLPQSTPLVLSSLFYLGAGAILSVISVLQKVCSKRDSTSREVDLRFEDAYLMAGVVLFGGVLAPVLMLSGLKHLSAASASLMLNLEAPFTVMLAAVLFRDRLEGQELLGAALVLVGSSLLSVNSGATVTGSVLAALKLAAAAMLWAIDNNLTQCLSTRNPLAVARVKTLAAGLFSLILTRTIGLAMPPAHLCIGALGIGATCYGASVVLYVYALRYIGAARQATVFATAPFVGALMAGPINGEWLRFSELCAGLVTAGGLALMMRHRHVHEHVHEELIHEHPHTHDIHHQHDHVGLPSLREPHSHWHRHLPMVHTHDHLPDLHHRHHHH